MPLYDLTQMLKHLPGKHSQASHASKRGGMPDRFAKEFGMDQGTYEEIAGSLGKDWGSNVLDAYEFKVGELRSEATKIRYMRKPGLVHIQGTVHDADGKQVGQFERFIDHEVPSVKHHLFTLDESVQGKGFGSAFYQHNEESYIKMGIEEITLLANKEVGGYAWARMGFDFMDVRGSADMYERFANSWSNSYDTEPPLVTASWDIAAAKGPDGKKIGREVMLGSNWDAAKFLDPSSIGYKVGQAYYEARAKKRTQTKQDTPFVESDTNGFWGPDEADDEWLKLVQDLLK